MRVIITANLFNLTYLFFSHFIATNHANNRYNHKNQRVPEILHIIDIINKEGISLVYQAGMSSSQKYSI